MAFPVDARTAARLGLAAVGATLIGIADPPEKFRGVSNAWFSAETYVLLMFLGFAAGMALVFLWTVPEVVGPIMVHPIPTVLLVVVLASLLLDILYEPSPMARGAKVALLRGAA